VTWTSDNDKTEVYGWFHTGPYVLPPSNRPLAVDLQGDGLAGIQVGTNRPPTMLGDFYQATGNTRVGATVGAAGAPEVFIDTPGNYGYFAMYSAGVLKWRMGTDGTGVQHVTIFDGLGSQLLQIRDTGVLVPIALAAAPAYFKGGIYFDTTLNKLRIGGATTWETVTSV